MFVFGGSYQTSLIDPVPISDETNTILNYDMDASTFASVSLASNENKPSNLIFPSVFQLSSEVLGVIWYELVF
jgi:hypothetical protein